MPCIINLTNQLENENTDGYFVYLGYSTTSGIAGAGGAMNDPNGNCFGITDPFTVAAPSPYLEGPPANQLPINPNEQIDYNVNGNSVDFTGVTPGFYGFMYIVGDTNLNGQIDGTECGDVECFEIEVIEGPGSMTAIDFDPVCEANLPVTIDLTNGSTGPDVPGVVNYIPGGAWGSTDPSIILTDPTIVTIPNGTAPGTIDFTYTIDATDLTSFHTPDGNCDNCSSIITVSIEITEQLSAGAGTSLAVCN